jgi:mono/diheme cytochrome c family protein
MLRVGALPRPFARTFTIPTIVCDFSVGKSMRRTRVIPGLMAGLVILTLTIVIRQAGSDAAAQAASTDARAAANSMFGERCAVCHGQNGDGKGPASESLDRKPVDFRDRKWQRSITDEKIAKAIVYGGPAVGLSASMTANPDLETQPGVVAALVKYVRALGDGRKR